MKTPFGFTLINCIRPVSYTHLDVYKRQKQAISIGVKEYLVKPVNIDDLIDRVRMTVEEIKHSTPILQTSNDFSSTIKKLLKDPNLVKEELALFIHSAGFRWNQPYLLTSLVELLPYDPLDEAKPAPLDLTEITDALSHSYPIEVFWMPGNKANQILLFFNLSSASDSSSVQETASNFIDTFCQKYNQQSTIAFSDMFSAYSFQSALRDAEKTLQLSLIHIWIPKRLLLSLSCNVPLTSQLTWKESGKSSTVTPTKESANSSFTIPKRAVHVFSSKVA